MAKRSKGYRGNNHNKKTSFNNNLYEKNRSTGKDEYSSSNTMAYWIYRICAVLFAVIMIMNYSVGNIPQATVYLAFLCVDLYLIHIYHKKTGK